VHLRAVCQDRANYDRSEINFPPIRFRRRGSRRTSPVPTDIELIEVLAVRLVKHLDSSPGHESAMCAQALPPNDSGNVGVHPLVST